MRPRILLVACVVLLAACSAVIEESTSTITVDGRSYDLRERILDGPNGPVKQTSVWVKGGYSLCLIDSPGDCEAAVRNARSRSSGS